MAFPTPPLPILLVVNALLGGLFIYAACEAYQLSNPNLDVATDFQPPWAEKMILQLANLISLQAPIFLPPPIIGDLGRANGSYCVRNALALRRQNFYLS
jgi:hypothetical protein